MAALACASSPAPVSPATAAVQKERDAGPTIKLVTMTIDTDDTELEVEINGEMYAAKVVGTPLYDPSGEKICA